MVATKPRDIGRAVWRHKKKVVVFFLVVMAAAIAAVFLLPRRYHSEAGLLVRLGRENTMLDPTATLQETTVAVPSSRENEMNSVVEILRSRTIAEKVVDALGPAFVLEPDADDEESSGWLREVRRQIKAVLAGTSRWLRELDGGPEMSDRQRAVVKLLDCCTVGPARKSNIVVIECRGPSPEWAQQVVGKLTHLYQGEHMRLNRPQGSLEFFTEQAERSRHRLAQQEDLLRDLKTATGLASPVEQRLALVARIARLQDDLMLTEAARVVSESKVEVLRKQLTAVPEKRTREETVGIGNQGTDLMREQFYQLQIKNQEEAAKYTEAHPRMQQGIRQVAAAEEVLRKEKPTRIQVTTAPHRVHEEAQLALLAEEPALASLQAKLGALGRQIVAVQAEIKSLNENELSIAKLQRDVELQQASYRRYVTDLEQARVDMALQEQRMSNISVSQPATYEPKPVFPRVALVLLFGLLFGVVGGVGLALLADWREHSFPGAEDLDIPRGEDVKSPAAEEVE